MTEEFPNGPGGPRTRLEALLAPGLVALGAVVLMCAPLFPGHWRLVVLPAVLLAPGHALLRLLGQPTGWPSISIAAPVSIVLVICASLIIDVSGIRLSSSSLGLLLGAGTALFLGASYWRHVVTGLLPVRRRAPLGDRTPVTSEATVGEQR